MNDQIFTIKERARTFWNEREYEEATRLYEIVAKTGDEESIINTAFGYTVMSKSELLLMDNIAKASDLSMHAVDWLNIALEKNLNVNIGIIATLAEVLFLLSLKYSKGDERERVCCEMSFVYMDLIIDTVERWNDRPEFKLIWALLIERQLENGEKVDPSINKTKIDILIASITDNREALVRYNSGMVIKAAINLGFAFLEGNGVTRDDEASYNCFTIAHSLGMESVDELLKGFVRLPNGEHKYQG